MKRFAVLGKCKYAFRSTVLELGFMDKLSRDSHL